MDRVTAAALPLPALEPSDRLERARLDAFFRGFGVRDAVELERLAGIACAEAARTGARSALAVAVRLTAQWLKGVLALDGVVPEALVRLGRASFMATGAAASWPGALLGDVPDAMTVALRRGLPVATPPLAPLAMPTQSLRAEPDRVAFPSARGAFGRSSRPMPAMGARAA